MQWDSSANGGFTTAAKPWLAVNPNYTQINARQEVDDPSSIYRYFARMTELHRNTPALIYGDYADLDPQNSKIFAYTRTLGGDKYLVVLNLSKEANTYTLPNGVKAGKMLITNLGSKEEQTSVLKLQAWEARVYRF